MEQKIHDFMKGVIASNPNEKEFLQAVEEVAEAVIPFMEGAPKYNNKMLLERMVEPSFWPISNNNIFLSFFYKVPYFF